MMAVSWPLSTVPTKEKVRWRMWLLSSERFFFSSMASNCEKEPEDCVNISLHFKIHYTSEIMRIPINRPKKHKWKLWKLTALNS